MPNQWAEHHLVTVWNPSYAADAMEQHLGLLLHLAGEYDKGAIREEQLYVWWGKVRSPNRQGPQANAEDIRRIANELDAGERDEVQLYLTDYQSLYVGDVDLIREGGPGDGESAHMPAYYAQERLTFDFSFRLRDIRRLVTRDMPEVIAELKKLRNVHYNDRPVSIFGGMVDLPLIVTRPDGRRFFDDTERDVLTGGALWAEFDAEHASAVAVLERDLRLNLLGEATWSRLEPEVRVFIAQAEKTFREHRDDHAFDFGPVVVAAHGGKRIDRQQATEWRDRILGVGPIGEIVELTKVRVKAATASRGTVRRGG